MQSVIKLKIFDRNYYQSCESINWIGNSKKNQCWSIICIECWLLPVNCWCDHARMHLLLFDTQMNSLSFLAHSLPIWYLNLFHKITWFQWQICVDRIFRAEKKYYFWTASRWNPHSKPYDMKIHWHTRISARTFAHFRALSSSAT